MNVKAISDLHGFLPHIENIDLLLICGDICPVINHQRMFQLEWFEKYFLEWIRTLGFNGPSSKVVLIPGNHDFMFEKTPEIFLREYEEKTNGRLKILINEEYRYKYNENFKENEIRIYGCPICKVFGNWAFMREDLDKYYGMIPEGVDILMVHDAPDIEGLGEIKNGPYKGENAGNKVLAKHILDRIRPKYAFCGHIHSGNHKLVKAGNTTLKNVSYVTEKYEVENHDIFEMTI